MSTKIWEAYRIPKSRLIEFTDLMHDSLFGDAVRLVEGLMSAVLPSALGEAIRSGKLCIPRDTDLSCEKRNRRARLAFVLDIMKEAAAKRERTAFDINCGFNVWFSGRYAYIIPITDMVCERPKFPDWVKGFHYQNSTDRPSTIPRAEWSRRRRKWDELCLGGGKSDHNARRFYHSVVDLTPPHHIMSHIDLQFAVLGNPREHPEGWGA